jgi:hypothetical protein
MNAIPASPPTTPPITIGVEGDVDSLEPPAPPVPAVLVGTLPPEYPAPPPTSFPAGVSAGCVNMDTAVEGENKESVVEVSEALVVVVKTVDESVGNSVWLERVREVFPEAIVAVTDSISR